MQRSILVQFVFKYVYIAFCQGRKQEAWLVVVMEDSEKVWSISQLP